MEDDPAPDKPRTSKQPVKEATPEQEDEETQNNGEQFPKGKSNRRSSQMTGEPKSQEQDNSVVTLTPVKNSKRKVHPSPLGTDWLWASWFTVGGAAFRFLLSSAQLGAHSWPNIL